MDNRVRNIHNFNPDTSILDLSSKVIIVTGGNSGVGKESVLQLAKHRPSKLYLAARSRAKFEAALEDIVREVPDAASHVQYLELDLGSFASVRSAVEAFVSSNDRLDVLMNNAGIMGSPPGVTTEGYEVQFGTNHLGHALLTKLLLPTLLRTAAEPASDVRIVNLSSAAYMVAPKGTESGFPFAYPGNNSASLVKTPTGGHRWTYTRYGQSKRANILHARALATIYGSKGITAVSVHPGRVSTNLLKDMYVNPFNPTVIFQKFADWVMGPMTVQQGALNQLWAAVAPKNEIENGTFYVPVGVEDNAIKGAVGGEEELVNILWKWQEGEFDAWLKSH